MNILIVEQSTQWPLASTAGIYLLSFILLVRPRVVSVLVTRITPNERFAVAKRVIFDKSTFDLPLAEYADSTRKAIYTKTLFDEIAHAYDRFALGPISFFREAGWKKWLVENVPAIPQGPIVDLATGTGELAFMAADRYPNRSVVGLDISSAMLAVAKSKNSRRKVAFCSMDLGKMSVADASVALFFGGYALRNTPDLRALLSDVHRLLIPGGIAAFLDFSKPVNPLHRAVNNASLRIWLSFWSLLLHRNLRIYNYIPSSLNYFPNHKALKRLMEETGFEILRRKRFMFGIAEAQIIKKAR
ncbi:MAG: methyltransferase domain-containing protein [Chitinivibrionales bacterium]|nr:methyltransferase domain-containing protein [Chitinivibrionales bacterium]MBD3355918.1 methyltransferase domain-containing protein [Chitinivibrionales bacterium]